MGPKHILTAFSVFALAIPLIAHASSVLIINGAPVRNIFSPIAADGFTPIQNSFRPGAIADHFSVPNDISEIWIWNDGTFGNTFTRPIPSRRLAAPLETGADPAARSFPCAELEQEPW